MKKAEPEPKSYFHSVLFPLNHKTSLSLKYHNCQFKRWIIWTWICIHLSQSGILVFRFSNTWLTCVSLPVPFQQMVLSFQHLNLLHSKFITWLIWAGLRKAVQWSLLCALILLKLLTGPKLNLKIRQQTSNTKPVFAQCLKKCVFGGTEGK